jgi:hypothetical protein
MKSLKIEKISLIVFFILFIVIPSVRSFGISLPVPNDLRMMQGDTAEFAFQIQTVGSTDKQSCTCYTEDFEPLIITFKEKNVIVNPGQAATVFATVTAPNDAPIKTYTGKIFASCKPVVEAQELSGSRISQTSGTKYTLSVVGTEGERKITEIPKPSEKETPTISTSSVITIIIIIAVIAIGVYYRSEKKRKKK